MLARYHRRRSEWIAKLGGVCVVCGTTGSLEFDHIVASGKLWNAGKIFGSASDALLVSEISKCQLLCNKHYIEKSLAAGDIKNVNHGGGLTGKRNCRCELCGPLKNSYNNELKKKKRRELKKKSIV
jgi:hypothetical protein